MSIRLLFFLLSLKISQAEGKFITTPRLQIAVIIDPQPAVVGYRVAGFHLSDLFGEKKKLCLIQKVNKTISKCNVCKKEIYNILGNHSPETKQEIIILKKHIKVNIPEYLLE